MGLSSFMSLQLVDLNTHREKNSFSPNNYIVFSVSIFCMHSFAFSGATRSVVSAAAFVLVKKPRARYYSYESEVHSYPKG